MSKYLPLLFLFSCCLHPVFAVKIQGIYLIKSDDTVRVTFIVPTKWFSQEINFQQIQGKIKYYDAVGKKQTLTPAKAKGFIFQYEGKTIQMLSRTNNLNLISSLLEDGNFIFLHLIRDGHLKLFRFYKTNRSMGMYNPATGMTVGGGAYTVEQSILQKGDDPLFRPRWVTCRKDLSNYFADCPALAEKIDAKTYTCEDIERVADFYNRSCR
jgi:hypothetical protein